MKNSIFLLALFTPYAYGHHGQDFFLNLDARVPTSLRTTAFMSSSWNDEEGTGLETGFLTGIGGGFAAGFHTAVSSANGSDASFDGFAPLLQWSIPIENTTFHLGMTVSYYFNQTAENSHAHSHSHRASRGNPDAPPPPVPLAIADPSIHHHSVDALQARFIMEGEISSQLRWVTNLIYFDAAGSDPAWGYSLGVRQQLYGPWAIGVEALGDFNLHLYQEMAVGIIYSPRHDLGLRFGYSHELGNSSSPGTLLGGLTYRF